MSVSSIRESVIDYAPCRYNGSRLWFRGPHRSLRHPYIACLGGSEVYGRYMTDPLPALLDKMLGRTVVNLGVENAGLDAFLHDSGALNTAGAASVMVIQLSGGHNISNRFYSVHPRRNDRFLKASRALRTLYPEMDFTEVHFTRHLLSRLWDICPDRFEDVRTELRNAWQARMRQVMGHVRGKVVLLWFAPQELPRTPTATAFEPEPFLDRTMLEPLLPKIAQLVEVVPDVWGLDASGRGLDDFDPSRAARLPGASAHLDAAQALRPILEPMIQ